MVDAAQSQWGSLAAVVDFGAAPVALGPASPAAALEDAAAFFLPIAIEFFPFEFGKLKRGSNGEQKTRKKTNIGARVKQIRPCILFIKENYIGFGLSDTHH
jgi:hypothetical protein